MIAREDISPVGKFFKTHALKGELNATFDDVEADIITPDMPIIVDIDGIFVPFYADSIRDKGMFSSLIKLHGIDDVEDAKPFVNKTIYLMNEDIPADENEGEGGYAEDFIGYNVADATLGEIGKITDVDLSTENALFIIEKEEGKIFIPIVDVFIESVDPDNKTINMNLPEGLIDLNLKS